MDYISSLMQETTKNVKETENMISALKELAIHLEEKYKVDNKYNQHNNTS